MKVLVNKGQVASEPFSNDKQNTDGRNVLFDRSFVPEVAHPDRPGMPPILLYKQNRHQSFLLSRIRADRFSRVQRPNILGADTLAKVLHKNRWDPWFVAPVLLPDRLEWEANHEQQLQEERLVAYLTFDGGRSADESHTNLEAEMISDLWKAHQNNVLHTLDLFSACLAESPAFKELLASFADRENTNAHGAFH